MANARQAREAGKERAEMVVDAGHRAAVHKSGFSSGIIEVPDGTPFFKFKKGVYMLEMIPWLTSKRIEMFDKDIQNHHKGPGSPSYEQTYWNHPFIGPNEETVVCLKKTFGKRCPICEEKAAMMKDPSFAKEDIAKLHPKERQAFWIVDHAEASKGPQLLDISFHNFGKLLDKRVNNDVPGGTRRFFADPKNGSTLQVEIDDATIGIGKPFAQASAIDFITPRKKALNPAWLKAAVPLSDCVKEMTYAEVLKIFTLADDAVEGATAASAEAPSNDELAGEAAAAGEEEGPIAWEVDHVCGFVYKDETLTGTIVKINAAKGLAMVQVEGKESDKPSVVAFTDLFIPEEPGDVDQSQDPPATDDGWGDEPAATAEAPAADDGWGDTPAAETGAESGDAWGDEPATTEAPAATDDGWGDDPAPAEPAEPAAKPKPKPAAAAPKPAPKPAAAPAAKPKPAAGPRKK